MRMHDKGLRERRKPPRALEVVSVSTFDEMSAQDGTHIGVGLAKVFRSSPATLFWGER